MIARVNLTPRLAFALQINFAHAKSEGSFVIGEKKLIIIVAAKVFLLFFVCFSFLPQHENVQIKKSQQSTFTTKNYMCLPLKMCILQLQIIYFYTCRCALSTYKLAVFCTCRCAFCSYRLSVFTPADVHFAATNISSCSSRLLVAIANHTRIHPSPHLAQRTCTSLVHFLAL